MQVICYIGIKDAATQKITDEKLFTDLTPEQQQQVRIVGNIQALTGLGYVLKKQARDEKNVDING